MERDREIIREIDRWRVVQGRHIRELVGFGGQRACDRRLRKLAQAGYISREKILYGVAGIYKNTSSATRIMEKRVSPQSKIRVEQILHDISVLDVAIFLNKKYGIEFADMKTEIELHRQDGFGVRKHRPDLIFTNKDNKNTCVEVELSLKSAVRFDKILQNNFNDYDIQIWVVSDKENKIARILRENQELYPIIEIIEMEEIRKWII